MKLLAARIFVFYEIAPPGLQNLIADLIYIRNEKYTILQIIRIYEPKSRLFKGMGIWIGVKLSKLFPQRKGFMNKLSNVFLAARTFASL